MSQRSASDPETDIEALFERTAGVDDIDPSELDDLCATVCHVVKRTCGARVHAIYVVGSFARGEAMEVASDIDLRVVCDDRPSDDTCKQCEHALRVEHGPHVTPDVCGFVDARLDTEPPDETEPSSLVWTL